MKHRVTFGVREKRRDQRRPIVLEGTVDGVSVHLTDVSFHGIGGRTVEPHDLAKLMRSWVDSKTENSTPAAAGDAPAVQVETAAVPANAVLEFTTPDGQHLTLRITIRRAHAATGVFGATFDSLTNAQFDAIERLMFPRLHAHKP